MSEAGWHSLAIIIPSAFVLVGRVWSMFEHRKTGKEISEIKISINGELEKRIAEARLQGIEEGKRSRE